MFLYMILTNIVLLLLINNNNNKNKHKTQHNNSHMLLIQFQLVHLTLRMREELYRLMANGENELVQDWGVYSLSLLHSK